MRVVISFLLLGLALMLIGANRVQAEADLLKVSMNITDSFFYLVDRISKIPGAYGITILASLAGVLKAKGKSGREVFRLVVLSLFAGMVTNHLLADVISSENLLIAFTGVGAYAGESLIQLVQNLLFQRIRRGGK